MIHIDDTGTISIEKRFQIVESKINDVGIQVAKIEEKQNGLLETIRSERSDKRSIRNQAIAGVVAILIAVLAGTWKLSDSIARNGERTAAEVSARIEGDMLIKERINDLTMKGPNYRGEIKSDVSRIISGTNQ